jgi:hypothetical protein
MANNLPKLKTTSSFKTKLDTAHIINLNCLKFILKNAAGLRFLKLFEFRIVRFFYAAGLRERQLHQGCAKVGLIHKAFRQIGAGGFYLKRLRDGVVLRKAYQSFQEHFCF